MCPALSLGEQSRDHRRRRPLQEFEQGPARKIGNASAQIQPTSQMASPGMRSPRSERTEALAAAPGDQAKVPARSASQGCKGSAAGSLSRWSNTGAGWLQSTDDVSASTDMMPPTSRGYAAWRPPPRSARAGHRRDEGSLHVAPESQGERPSHGRPAGALTLISLPWAARTITIALARREACFR